jgi:membrane protein DedA with SNARE-associated domain
MSDRWPTTPGLTLATLLSPHQEAGMTKTAATPTTFNRQTWIGFIAADVVLFVLANVTAKNSQHPGTASNILFTVFVIATMLLIAFAIVTAVRSRRAARR